MPAPGAPRSADAILEAVRATGLLGDAVVGDGPVLLMCSAGRDSHALLDVAVRLRGAQRVQVLHVDHGLRAGAAADAEQMAARCAALGVSMVVRSAGPREGSAAVVGDEPHASPLGTGPDRVRSGGSGNVHAWARAARARLAEAERARIGASFVVTAHTRSDLVETALARFATQPGRRALLAMRDREDGLVRPLLGISREETAAYCRERGIAWRDDPSNADPRFSRARLRHGVMPVLRSLNPKAEEAIVRTLGELAEEAAVLDALVDAELEAGEDGAAAPGPAPSIALARLAALPTPLGRLVLRAVCERTLGRPCARVTGRLDDVLALAAASERTGRGSVDVGDGARIEVRGGVIRCVASSGPAAPSAR